MSESVDVLQILTWALGDALPLYSDCCIATANLLAFSYGLWCSRMSLTGHPYLWLLKGHSSKHSHITLVSSYIVRLLFKNFICQL